MAKNIHLDENDIQTEKRISRRSALGRIGATALGAAAAGVVLSARPETASATSDSDSGPNADPAGRGRTGRTDSDSGPNADRGGHGRGCSDSDSGPNSDPGGRGRSC